MPVTSLTLSDELKLRIQSLVKDTDRTAHAFMVEAIERAARAEESRRQFGADAVEAESEVMASGRGFEVREVFAYLEARADGKAVRRPRMKAWRASS